MGILGWAVVFLAISLIAAAFGFGGAASAAGSVAKILFLIFLVVFLVLLVINFHVKT